MGKIHKIFWVIIIVVIVGVFLWQKSPFVSLDVEKIKEITDESLIQNLQEKIITSDPLRGEIDSKDSLLTRAGITEWTNYHRNRDNLQLLQENTKLNASAALKVQDMFESQYFAHLSPLEEGVGDLVKNVSYEFIVIGENLALGNFKDDKTLVRAWMDSPGHRANILNESYQEMGVAVSMGIFEGSDVWIAVQHFGKSKSVCPNPSELLLLQIESNKIKLESLASEIEVLKNELDLFRSQKGNAYNKKVRKYNEIVREYNLLAEKIKKLVIEYNLQIEAFNICAIK